MRLASHEWTILGFGVLCGITAAFAGAWLLLRLAVVDELDPIALPLAVGMIGGIAIGAIFVVMARRARI